jgi:hypothetical protein
LRGVSLPLAREFHQARKEYEAALAAQSENVTDLDAWKQKNGDKPGSA